MSRNQKNFIGQTFGRPKNHISAIPSNHSFTISFCMMSVSASCPRTRADKGDDSDPHNRLGALEGIQSEVIPFSDFEATTLSQMISYTLVK